MSKALKKKKRKQPKGKTRRIDPLPLLRQGRVQEAESMARRQVKASPKDARAWHVLGLCLLQENRFGDASEALEQSVKYAVPKNAPWYELGNAYQGLGDLDKAAGHYEKALAVSPYHAYALQALGEIALKRGDAAQAVERLQAALKVNPALPRCYNNLGIAYSALKNPEQAISSFKEAIRQAPEFAEAHNNLGATLKANGQIAEAVQSYKKAVELVTTYGDAWANLGNAYYTMGRYQDAVEAGKRALEIKPESDDAANNLANALQAMGRYAEAIPYFERILKKHPGHPLYLCNYASVLADLGRFDEAMDACRRALAVDPGFAQAYKSMGNYQAMLGNKSEAETWYRRALEAAPESGSIWRHFSKVHRFTPDDPDLHELKEWVGKNQNDQSPGVRSEFLFALSKAHDDLGEHEAAFELLAESNALYRQGLDVNTGKIIYDYQHLAQIFSRENITQESGKGYASDMPVFILGMPRSGTTLVEQILASHPEIHGGGELDFLSRAIGPGFMLGGVKCTASHNDTDNAPDKIRSFVDIGQAYNEMLQALSPTSRRITDKMPGNFSRIGLIALALPGAKIIHCRPNPLDTCLSCFRQRFTRGIEWSYDLHDLAAFYNGYARLMEHWRQVVPEAFIEVDYEELVRDIEPQARRLIEYTGLEWSDDCLRFYETKRVVKTASLEQVRRPAYSSSVEAWKKYEKGLRVLREEISPEVLEPYGIEPIRSRHSVAGRRQLQSLFRQKKFEALVDKARQYLASYNEDALIWTLVCGTLRKLGRSEEALEAGRKAVDLDPENSAYQGNLGLMYKDLGRLDEAQHHYERAISLNPNDFSVYNNLGVLNFEQGRLDQAVDCYAKALELRPEYVEAANNLGNVYYEQGRYHEAKKWYEKATGFDPKYVKAVRNIGVTERSLGRLDNALMYYRQALTLDPNNSETHLSMAKLLGDMGRFEEAEKYGLTAAKDHKLAAEALTTLIRMRKMTPEDSSLLEKGEALCRQNLLPRQASVLHFALGKFHDDVAGYEKAFAHYKKANELAKKVWPAYNPEKDRDLIQRWVHAMSQEAVPAAAGKASASEVPVFIVGMPRSGTTLLEQIIASHPQAAGAGELTFWGEAFTKYKSELMQGVFGEKMRKDLAERYLAELSSHGPDAKRVTDKMPGNYAYTGLMHAVFPKARFIHARRHPVDTCLSIYFQNFTRSHVYGCDLQHLVDRYRIYEALMAHWRTILPKETLLEVSYEELIEDQEGWSRRIIDFIGLPWDDTCLSFHRTDRAVQTASKWQVRQKIYKTSKARWKRYEPWLGPLRQLMGDNQY